MVTMNLRNEDANEAGWGKDDDEDEDNAEDEDDEDDEDDEGDADDEVDRKGEEDEDAKESWVGQGDDQAKLDEVER